MPCAGEVLGRTCVTRNAARDVPTRERDRTSHSPVQRRVRPSTSALPHGIVPVSSPTGSRGSTRWGHHLSHDVRGLRQVTRAQKKGHPYGQTSAYFGDAPAGRTADVELRERMEVDKSGQDRDRQQGSVEAVSS